MINARQETGIKQCGTTACVIREQAAGAQQWQDRKRLDACGVWVVRGWCRLANSAVSPDQYVGQGAQQAEGGNCSEVSEQQAGQQTHQRQQGGHESGKGGPRQAVRQQTGRDHQVQCASHQQFDELQRTKKKKRKRRSICFMITLKKQPSTCRGYFLGFRKRVR